VLEGIGLLLPHPHLFVEIAAEVVDIFHNKLNSLWRYQEVIESATALFHSVLQELLVGEELALR